VSRQAQSSRTNGVPFDGYVSIFEPISDAVVDH